MPVPYAEYHKLYALSQEDKKFSKDAPPEYLQIVTDANWDTLAAAAFNRVAGTWVTGVWPPPIWVSSEPGSNANHAHQFLYVEPTLNANPDLTISRIVNLWHLMNTVQPPVNGKLYNTQHDEQKGNSSWHIIYERP